MKLIMEELSSGDFCQIDLNTTDNSRVIVLWRLKSIFAAGPFSMAGGEILAGEDGETYEDLYSLWVTDTDLLTPRPFEDILTIEGETVVLDARTPLRVITPLYYSTGTQTAKVVVEALDRPELPIFQSYAIRLRRMSSLEALARLGQP